MQRERFKSRLGFILISAGCAVGLGNVWRFPWMVGEYGGAAFVVLYLIFLIGFGVPIMTMEFAVGRASQKSIARSFDVLEPKGSRWHWAKWLGFVGLYMLMMFYTTVAGWMLAYIPKMATAPFSGAESINFTSEFNSLLASPEQLVFWMIITCAISLLICSFGLQKGVERFTKVLMIGLLILIIVLIFRAVTLEGSDAGIAFYLMPDFSNLLGSPERFGEAIFAALGQAFFTLSIGIGSMEIFGSYINKDYALTGEAMRIAGLDTIVALGTGLIIFPACFAFNVAPDSGPGLVFITLPAVFEQMWGGNLWATLFFILMSFAAISTVIAVFEGILSFWMDEWNLSRKRAVAINIVLIPLLSLPCALGFNILDWAQIPGIGNIQSIEDFLVSNNFLVIGSLIFVLFCVSKRGWGWKNFLEEADTGSGMRFPTWLHNWMHFGVPLLIVIIFIMGWWPIISSFFTA